MQRRLLAEGGASANEPLNALARFSGDGYDCGCFQGRKPGGKLFGSSTWRIVRNCLVGLLATFFVIWLVLFITKGRFLK